MATCGSSIRRVQKLEDVCFSVIEKNFDEMFSKLGSTIRFKFLKKKSQRLLRTFYEMNAQFVPLKPGLFCVNQYLWDLDLDWFKVQDVPAVIKKLQTVENTLVSVSATAQSKMSSNVLWQLVHVMPETLMRLSLRETNFSDQMLAVVTKRCPNLQILDLMGCNNISDDGVKAMCETDEEGNVHPNYVLQKLNVDVPTVTKDAVLYILKNIPNLSELYHSDLGEVMWNIVQDQLNISTCNLTSVYIKRTEFPLYDGLIAVSSLCPYVTKLHVDISTQEELDACAKFTLLYDVCFNMHGQCDCSSFFEKRGKNIRVLTINNCAQFSMSVESLAKFCSQLKCVSFYNLEFKEVMPSAKLENGLCHLTEFTIELVYRDNLLETLAFIMTQSKNLKKIVLVSSSPYPQNFRDSLIQHVSASTLKELEMWKVDVCVSVFNTMKLRFRFELWL